MPAVAPAALPTALFAAPTDKDEAVGAMILHPAQHGSGHLGLDARHIGARPGERLLDLIHKHDHPRGFATQKHGRQESLDVFATADLIERLAAAPDCKSWRLLNRLALPLPQPVEIEAVLR